MYAALIVNFSYMQDEIDFTAPSVTSEVNLDGQNKALVEVSLQLWKPAKISLLPSPSSTASLILTDFHW